MGLDRLHDSVEPHRLSDHAPTGALDNEGTDAGGVGERDREGLFYENVLTDPARGLDDREMEHRWNGNNDGVGIAMREKRPVIVEVLAAKGGRDTLARVTCTAADRDKACIGKILHDVLCIAKSMPTDADKAESKLRVYHGTPLSCP
jgi:hypothetical protein